jgi:excisionase family DNA binding protein
MPKEFPLALSIERRTLSVEQAAKILGISRGLAYELASAGELPVVRLGKRIVVPIDALNALLDSATTANASRPAPGE